MKFLTLYCFFFLFGSSLIAQNNLFKYEENGKYGYRTGLGEVVVPATFDEADDFEFGRGGIVLDGKVGVIDVSGDFVFSPRYEYNQAFSERGLISPVYVVGDGTGFGLINKDDELLISLEHDSIYWSGVPFVYMVITKEKVGVIKINKELDSASVVIDEKFESINLKRSGDTCFFEAIRKNKTLYYDQNFEVISAERFNELKDESEEQEDLINQHEIDTN